MPYKSDKQRKFFNVAANRAQLEAEGVDVNEWNQSSKGLKLPATAPETKSGPGQLLRLKKKAANPVGDAFDKGVDTGLGPFLTRQLLLSDRIVQRVNGLYGPGQARGLYGPGQARVLRDEAAKIPSQAARLLDKVQKRLSNPQLPPPPPKIVGPILKHGQLRDKDKQAADLEVDFKSPGPFMAGVRIGANGETQPEAPNRFWRAGLTGLKKMYDYSGPRGLSNLASELPTLPARTKSLSQRVENLLTKPEARATYFSGPFRNGVRVRPMTQHERPTPVWLPGPTKSSEENMVGQLLDMDRDELLEKLAHMELRNRAVQRIKAALKLPGSGEAAKLLSSWKGDLAGTVRAANPTLLDKIQTMARPHVDKATHWMDAHPTETLGIGGALGGAAIGGLSSLAGPRKKKRVLSNMLTGGLAGGALGLGGGALAQGLGLGESFGAMKGNISRAIEPVPEIKPNGEVQERIAKAETEKEVAEIAEAIKPVNSAGGAIGGMGIDTAKAVGNAVKDTTTSHPFATGAVGAPLAVGAHAAVNRKAVSSGRARLEPNVPNQGLNPLGSSTGVFGLDDGRFGVSVNAAEDAARGIQKAREMATRSKAPDLSTLRRYFPGVPDAQLVSTAQHVENQLNQTIQQRNAGVGPALAPAMHGPAAPPLHRPTGGDMLQRALGDTFTPPGQTPLPTAAPHAPPPRTMPRAAPPAPPPSYAVNITPQQQLRGATIAASEAAPWLAHDLPAWMARAMPRVNNAYRHGVKGIPPVAALAAIIQEHRRIAALNAARQGGETLAQP